MTKQLNTDTDHPGYRAAVKLLRGGYAAPAEVAHLAGISRQLLQHWARGIDWRKARNARLSRLWRTAKKC